MFLLFSNNILFILILLLCSKSTYANTDLNDWLQKMGCVELQALYLESILREGNLSEQENAAKKLADVYALILARSENTADQETLERAVKLFKNIPQAGTTELRLQLYRATYLATEQLLERYRLRLTTKKEADLAVEQLIAVISGLDNIQKSLLKRSRSSRTFNDTDQEQLGLSTNYLAWAKYYVAWHKKNINVAKEAELLFASMLLGDEARLQKLSLDLKSHEMGARAILGIALTKELQNSPLGSEPWLEQLESDATWSAVRLQLPLWRLYIAIDNKQWSLVSEMLQSNLPLDMVLANRIVAVHALENKTNHDAKRLAILAVNNLIDLEQLGIVSEIVGKFGSNVLDQNSFISNYINADIAYREEKQKLPGSEPAKFKEQKNAFANIAKQFEDALNSSDSNSYEKLRSSCKYMLGLSLFYSSQFKEASLVFQDVTTGEFQEQALWMAIVSLNKFPVISNEDKEKIVDLAQTYLNYWPNSAHATQLKLFLTGNSDLTQSTVDELLAIPKKDPKYEDAQRQASRSQYQLWLKATPDDRPSIGNLYVSIAQQLIDADITTDSTLRNHEIAAIRIMRLLEVSLHPDILRIEAAKKAIESIKYVEEQNLFPISEFKAEILYRRCSLAIIEKDELLALKLWNEIRQDWEDTPWHPRTATKLWHTVDTGLFSYDQETVINLGNALLKQEVDVAFTSRKTIDVALKTSKTLQQVGNLEDALKIAALLLKFNPNTVEIIELNAELQYTLGNSEKALSLWKILSSGTLKGGMTWTKARYFVILLISEHHPSESLQLLEQHKLLYPNFGAGEFSSHLKDLYHRLLKDKE